MQTAILEIHITKTEALHAANRYVKTHIGKAFDAVRPNFSEETKVWSFFIEGRVPDLDVPLTSGQIFVNSQTGEPILLSDVQIWDIQQCVLMRAEHKRGNRLARGEDGMILAYQAKIKVNAYMGNHVAFFASSDGIPDFVPERPPFWRVETKLLLSDYGKVTDLGPVYVSAISGEVVPLDEKELKTRQEKAKHAAIAAKRST